MLDGPDQLRARFEALTALLTAHRPLWAARPFALRTLPWESERPEVAAWLRSLPPDRAAPLDRAPADAEDAPAAFGAWARAAAALSAVPDLSEAPPRALAAARLAQAVPGRKWQQVRAFVGALRARRGPTEARVVDWCAGKGHLGRAVHLATGRPVVLLERRRDLCDAGAALSRRVGVDAATRFVAADVLTDGAAHLGPDTLGVGLHACGILWRTLLADAARTGAAAAVAPCCHHALAGAATYAPLSDAGRAAALPFRQPELRLSVAEERNAPRRERRRRARAEAYRLGLDLLLREASGQDVYVPQGPLPTAMFDQSFEAFSRQAARHIERDLPASWDPDAAERAGWARAREVAALSVVRALFRRPLELWLVLDAALAQVEGGRRVRVGTFCDAALTPRNLIVVSWPDPR